MENKQKVEGEETNVVESGGDSAPEPYESFVKV